MSEHNPPPSNDKTRQRPLDQPPWVRRLRAGRTVTLDANQLDAVLAWLGGREHARDSDGHLAALLQHVGPARADEALTQNVLRQLDACLFIRGALDLEGAHVDHRIDRDERRVRYRRLMNAFHPDRFGADQATFLTARSQAIVAAYQRFKKGEDNSPDAGLRVGGNAPGADDDRRSPAQWGPQGETMGLGDAHRWRTRLERIKHLHIKIPMALATVLLLPLTMVALLSEPQHLEPGASVDASTPEASPADGRSISARDRASPPSADEITRSSALLNARQAQTRQRMAQVRSDAAKTASRPPPDLSPTRFDPNPEAIPPALLASPPNPTPTPRPPTSESPRPEPPPAIEPQVAQTQQASTPNSNVVDSPQTAPTDADTPATKSPAVENPTTVAMTDTPARTSGAESSVAESSSPAATRRLDAEATQPNALPEAEPAPSDDPVVAATSKPPVTDGVTQAMATDAAITDDPEATIRALLEQHANAFEAGDIARYLFAVAPSARENTLGDRESIARHYAGLFDRSGKRSMSVNVVRVRPSNDGFDVLGLLNRAIHFDTGVVERTEAMARYRIERQTNDSWRIVAIEY